MTLRDEILAYMKAHQLSRREMARLVDIPCGNLGKYLDGLPVCSKEITEAALRGYLLRIERAQARAKRPEFIETTTARIILEKCQEADERRELALLYGPSGIGKTFALEEFVGRAQRQEGPEKGEVLFVTAHSASTPKSLMAALCLQAGVPHQATAAALAEVLVRKLQAGRYLIIVDEANHLDIEAMELLRYVYDCGHLGVVLVGTLRLYEIFTDGSRPASELEQLWSRVGICELLPGLTEWEARRMIQESLGRLPELTIKQILQQTGNSIRRMEKLLEGLKELRGINVDRKLEDLVPVAASGLLALTR